MTVKCLIEKLEKLDPDAEIYMTAMGLVLKRDTTLGAKESAPSVVLDIPTEFLHTP